MNVENEVQVQNSRDMGLERIMLHLQMEEQVVYMSLETFT
jgi:hypothetical protein